MANPPGRSSGNVFGPVGASVSWGWITDTHHDPIKATDTSQGGKYYTQSAAKVADIVTAFNARNDLAFVFQNGDFIDGSVDNATATTDLQTIVGVLNGAHVPVYHNIGNHELWMLSKPQVLNITGQPGKYYSFVKSGVTFIVLDGNYTADDDGMDLDPTTVGRSPYVSYIPPIQRAWLEATIAASTYPCVIMCHYPLYYVGAFGWGITNAAAVRQILEAYTEKIICCCGGHLHDNFIRIVNGITYISTHATVTGAYPALNYAVFTVYPQTKSVKVSGFGFDMSHVPSAARVDIISPQLQSAASPGADAWCWFHEPRAVSKNGKTWFGTSGSDNNSVLQGRIAMHEITEASGAILRKVLATSTGAALWADDHDYPSAPVFRPDGRLVTFYSPHRTGGPISFRISVSPYTMADGWSREYSIGNDANYPTYPSPVFLSGEANKLYVFYRNGLTGGPVSYITSTDIATCLPATVDGGDLGSVPTWSAETQLSTSAGTQGIYHKVTSNGIDRIDLLMTDAVGPQAGTKNDVRHAYLTGGVWYTSAGVSLGALPITFSSFTAVATSGAPDNLGDMWCDHIQRRASGVIEAVFHRFVSTSDHRLYYARYAAGAWTKVEIDAGFGMGNPDTRSTQITDGQGAVEGYYSPGAFLDTVDEGVVYCGVGTATYSQLYRYTTKDGGSTWTRERVSRLPNENVRPVVPVNRSQKYAVLWMNGAYHYYDFNTNPLAGDVGYTTQIMAASRAYATGSVAPVSTTPPSIGGSTGTLGNVLQANLGVWNGDMPMTFAYQWVKAGVDISGATSSTYTITSGDVGTSITVRVTATNSVGSVSVTSSPASALPTNLLLHSETFNQWTPVSMTLATDVANDPVNAAPVADRIIETSTTAGHVLNSASMNFVSGTAYTFSIYAKYETAQFLQILFGSAAFGGNGWGNFDIQNQQVKTIGSATTAAIVDAGGGWCRCSITATATATASAPVAVGGANVATMTRAASYAGSTGNTRLLADAQVESGSTANTYVPTT